MNSSDSTAADKEIHLSPPTSDEPVLRTLSPALRQLERSVRNWLDGSHAYPLSVMTKAGLEGLANDLRRQADALDMDRPLLHLMLMGGTGVGKSTLLNALAGGAIAQASFARPTTREAVVYYHESVKPDRLDPALRQCHLAPHNRPELRDKILIDTPDLDSNDLSNREVLFRVLPLADIVLYVGSQEKYHDKLGWDLFLQQRRRRAFAFVLNKWDRCQHAGAAGLRPDEDLLRDLKEEGFQNPLLFRTCAQQWVDLAQIAERETQSAEPGEPGLLSSGEAQSAEHETQSNGQVPEGLPEGEQFVELIHWINKGLNRLEIEAIKARGISQLLNQLHKTLESASPPDLTEAAAQTRTGWERILEEEAGATAEVLLNTLEPYQREIEHHFAVESQRRFRGVMAFYLQFFTKVKYVGNTLRDRIPFLPRTSQAIETQTTWDLTAFTRACSSLAGERHLDARGRALANRLLVEADQRGYPLHLLSQPTEAVSQMDWQQRYAVALTEILKEVEQQWSKPTGTRRLVQNGIIFLADWLPSLALLGTCGHLLWQYTMESRPFDRGDLVLPLVVVLIVLILLHVVIALVLPLRWPAMRSQFLRHLERRLQTELDNSYSAIPLEVAEAMRQERQRVEKLVAETHEVTEWLQQREEAASIAGLYGN